MKREWKEIPTGDVHANGAGFNATLNPKGEIAMNRWTYRQLGEPEAVHILYDKANNTIGLKPTSPTFRNAYRIRPRGLYGGRVVWALRLLREANLELPETIQFQNMEIDLDGILILDLRQARRSARAAGVKAARARDKAQTEYEDA